MLPVLPFRVPPLRVKVLLGMDREPPPQLNVPPDMENVRFAFNMPDVPNEHDPPEMAHTLFIVSEPAAPKLSAPFEMLSWLIVVVAFNTQLKGGVAWSKKTWLPEPGTPAPPAPPELADQLAAVAQSTELVPTQ